MATRTLGVKFEVVGFKEAANSIERLKESVNDSLRTNRLSSDEAIRDSRRIRAEQNNQKSHKNTIEQKVGAETLDPAGSISSGRDVSTAKEHNYLDSSFLAQQQLEKRQFRQLFKTYVAPRLNTVQGGFFEGIGSEAGRRSFNSFDSIFRRLTGRKQYQETVEIGNRTIAKLAAAIGYKIKFKKGNISSQVQFNKSVNRSIANLQSNSLVGSLLDRILMPLKTINYSFFEGIGSYFGQQYASGFSSVLEQEQDVSFERKGRVGGKALGYVKDKGISGFFVQIKSLATEYRNLLDNLPETDSSKDSLRLLSLFFKQIAKTITYLPASVLTGHRKGSVVVEGLPKVQEFVDNLQDEDLPDLEGKTRVLFTVGGFAAEKGQSGMRMAQEISKSAADDTAVIGADNSFTDLNFSVFGNKLLWGADLLQKIASLNVKGFNPDSVKLAAQVIAILKSNPQLKEVRLTGHSAGGFVVEEVQELLDLLGYAQKVTSIATGTPETVGGLNNENVERKLGDNDDIVKGAEEAGSYLGITNERDKADELEGVASHYGEDYLTSSSYLKTVLGEGFDEGKNKKLRKERSPFKGQLIELETLYVNYLSLINDELNELIEELSIAPDRLIAKARREKIRNRSVEELSNKISQGDFEKLNLKQNTETAVIVIGGVGGEKGKSGKNLAAKLGKLTSDESVQYFGGDNPFTDALSKEQMMGEDAEKIATKHIIDVFYEAHKKGVNPDAIPIAAQILDLQKKDPDLKIRVLGNSAGGYIAEDVIALLAEYGADLSRIEVIGSGTPELPGGVKNKKLKKLLGSEDNVFNISRLKEINEKFQSLFGFPIFGELASDNQNIENIQFHELFDYIANSEELQKFLFDDSVDIDELLNLDDAIARKRASADASTKLAENIAANPNLSEELKIQQIQRLRDAYVQTLQDIVLLAEKAQELGGGRRFSQEGKKAYKELQSMGVIEDEPVNEPKNTSSVTETANSNIDSITASINERRQNKSAIESELASLQSNPELTQEQIIEKAYELRERYIKVLQDIVILARRAKKLAPDDKDAEQEDNLAQAQLRQLNAEIPVDEEVLEATSSAPPTDVAENPVVLPETIGLQPENKETVPPNSSTQELSHDPDGGVSDPWFDTPNPITTGSTQEINYDPDGGVSDPWFDTPNPDNIINVEELTNRYKQFLNDLVESSSRTAETTVNTIVEDFKTIGKDSQQNYLETIRSAFNVKARLFREAVRSGQLDIAKDQGEQLLKMTALLKVLYRELDEDAEIDGEVRAKLLGMRRYATSVQNEVIEGTGGRGRVDTGLTDLFSVELVNLEEEGGNVVSGFVESILAQLGDVADAGEAIGDKVQESTRESLDMQSPSRKFQEIGRFVIEGFRQGLRGMDRLGDEMEQRGREVVEQTERGIRSRLRRTVVNIARTVVDAGRSTIGAINNSSPSVSTATDNIVESASIQLQELREDLEEEFEEELSAVEDFVEAGVERASSITSDALEQFLDRGAAQIIKEIGSMLFDASQGDNFDEIVSFITEFSGKILKLVVGINLLKVAAETFGLGKLNSVFSNLPVAALDAANAVEVLDNRIIDISGSAIEGANNLEFIAQTARDLGKDLTAAKENYAELLGATQYNSLKGTQTEIIYTAFADLAKRKGLSQAQEDRLFNSIRSMIGKEYLSQEEVRQEISEVLPDFAQALARSQGMSVPQLNTAIESRQITASDALPKVAQFYMAQGSITNSANTGAAAVNNLDRAINRFRESVGFALQPIQKFGNNFLAGFFNSLATSVEKIKSLAQGFFIVLSVNITRYEVFGQSIQKILLAIIKLIWAARGALGGLIAQVSILTIAILAFQNSLKVMGNAFPEAEKNIKALTLGVQNLKQAYDDARDSGKNLARNLPQKNEDLSLNEGMSVPKQLQWLVGGESLNLDNLFRKRLARIDQSVDKGLKALFGKVPGIFNKYRVRTYAEKKQEDLVEGNKGVTLAVNEVLGQKSLANAAIEDMQKLDARLREIQSARTSLLSGDTEGLDKSLEKERRILEEREKLLKITSQYQQNLDLSIKAVSQQLESINELAISDGIIDSAEKDERAGKQAELDALQTEKNRVNKQLARLANELSGFERSLRNTNERIAGFNEAQDKLTSEERAEIVREGIELDKGSITIEIELDDLTRRDLKNRITSLDREITKLEKNLDSPALAPGAQRVIERLKRNNIPLNEQSLQRIIDNESTVAQDRDAAKYLLELRRLQREKYQYDEQLAQSLQNTRGLLLDFDRTIEDYFFNLTQRLKEARVETKTLISQIGASNIKNKLRSALLPGSDSFINGIIDGIQGILDQAQSLIERSLGIESSVIGFESETRALELEMRDFIRSVGGATDAVTRFSNTLDNVPYDRASSTHSSDDIITNLRRAIIGKESDGLFNAVNPHSGALGYGQVMPFNVANWTREATGRAMNPEAFLSNPGAQIKTIDHKLKQYLDRELKATGGNLDKAVRRVASTWYSGRPELYNNTRPQTYGAGKYPSINDYTADILKRFRSESGGNVLTTNSRTYNNTNNNTDNARRASTLKNQVVNNLGQNVNLQEIMLQLDLDGQFENAIANEKEKIRRQFEVESLTTENKGLDLEDKLAELSSRSSLTTARTEMLSQLRSTASEFRNIKVEGVSELLRLGDTLANTKGVVEVFPRLIEAIKNSGNEQFIASIPVLQETLDSAIAYLPQINRELDKAEGTYRAIAQTEKDVTDFIERQGKLRIEAENITESTALQTVRTTIATERGSLELRRQNEITAERLRLEQRINEIRQQYGDTNFADNLIQLEKQQSRINRENIDRSAEDRELEYEQKLLQLDEGIASSRGGLLDRLGANFKGNKIRREAAIAQENFRFEQELLQLRRKYEAEPEKLEILIQKAEELNRVKLEQIKKQFGGLREKIEELSLQSLTNFFENVFNAFSSNGDKQRQLLEQELAYNKELLSLEEKYRDNPGGLDFARERVKKLNEEKLDKIKGEFNIFNRVVDAARQAVIFLLKEIARMAAVRAASSILTSVIGGGVGGAAGGAAASSSTTTSMDFGSSSAISAFTAYDGITVSKPISARLQDISPSIRNAFKREGKQGVLGVFTPGEEILSIKTGEAGRYQALKKKLGIDPLKKIVAGNFKTGGTVDIEGNLLSQLNTSSPNFNVKNISTPSIGKVTNNNVTNFSASIVTPDADSFRESSYQRQQDIAEALIRAR